METRAGASKKFKGFAQKDDGVVLQLEKDVEKGWPSEQEVHYDHAVAAEGAEG